MRKGSRNLWGRGFMYRMRELALPATRKTGQQKAQDQHSGPSHLHQMASAMAASALCARPSTLKGPSARKTFAGKASRPIRAASQFKVHAAPKRAALCQLSFGDCLQPC